VSAGSDIRRWAAAPAGGVPTRKLTGDAATMQVLYWIVIWVLMIVAFTAAWTFIVKGCEALDRSNPPDEE
jgi:hypothetical protein